MAKFISTVISRLRRILKRQDAPGWGADYIPSILATREEAPSTSRPARVYSKLLGRYCHTLSTPERVALLLALHHPALFELHEQRMLATDPRPHPLTGHPCAAGYDLPHLRGTVAVAERLDLLKYQPVLYVEDADNPGARLPVPVPLIGDLLLFLSDEEGPYCVNWTVKATTEDFERPHWRGKVPRNPEKAITAARIRHAIEETYYLDAGIRTVRVTGDAFEPALIGNLHRIFCWHSREHELHEEDRLELVERLRASITMQIPPLEVFAAIHRRIPCSLVAKKAVMFQAIWRRELRVDLFDLITPDRPLRPECIDILVKYGHWFAREAA